MFTRILLIEDNPDHALLTKRILTKATQGYQLDYVNGAEEGMSRIFQQDYDLVLCDYRMAGLTALDILKEMCDKGKDLPLIIITSSGNEKIAVEAMKQGAYDYVVKDLSYEDTLPMIIQKSIERYNAKKDKERLERELVESEQKYRSIFDNANDAIFVADTDTGNILDVNKQGERLVKRPKEEIIGMNWLDLYPPDRTNHYRDNFKTQIQKNRVEDFDAEVIQKDGSRVPVYISASVMELGDRKVIQGIFKDMTDFKRMEEQLIQSSKMAAMGQLVAGVSHELNQPLTGIKGFAQAVLMDLEENSPLRKDLQKIVEQADRMDKIIKNMRLFVKKSEFKMEELDIHKPLQDSLMLLCQQLKVHNIRLNTLLDNHLPKLIADPNQLQQVFLNLLTNARDAIDSLKNPEGGEITVRTSLSKDKNSTEITFQDTGCGIPKENLEQIFNPFFTTKSSNGGIGLGLSIVYRIIENHKGSIQVESQEGKGTTFRITLPILPIESV